MKIIRVESCKVCRIPCCPVCSDDPTPGLEAKVKELELKYAFAEAGRLSQEKKVRGLEELYNNSTAFSCQMNDEREIAVVRVKELEAEIVKLTKPWHGSILKLSVEQSDEIALLKAALDVAAERIENAEMIKGYQLYTEDEIKEQVFDEAKRRMKK